MVREESLTSSTASVLLATHTLLRSTVYNTVRPAHDAWQGAASEAAQTFTWFWQIQNTALVTAAEIYVDRLLAGPRPTRRDLDGEKELDEELFSWGIWEPEEVEKRDELDANASLEERQDDLGRRITDKLTAAKRTLEIMGPDVQNLVRQAANTWSGNPKTLSEDFLSQWESNIHDHIWYCQWLLDQIRANPSPL